MASKRGVRCRWASADGGAQRRPDTTSSLARLTQAVRWPDQI
ncbi:hypothetical protein [Streptomyces violarus]|nr:hypothetical protein [Streptomyces violarus]MCT9144524.1 hypothetical protein [Streptomyces violarus]